MKIKTTITESREIETEVDVPYFCKTRVVGQVHFFAVGEEGAIKVINSGGDYASVVKGNPSLWAEEISKSVAITEREFISEYTKAWVAIEEGREELERLSIINSIPI